MKVSLLERIEVFLLSVGSVLRLAGDCEQISFVKEISLECLCGSSLPKAGGAS